MSTGNLAIAHQQTIQHLVVTGDDLPRLAELSALLSGWFHTTTLAHVAKPFERALLAAKDEQAVVVVVLTKDETNLIPPSGRALAGVVVIAADDWPGARAVQSAGGSLISPADSPTIIQAVVAIASSRKKGLAKSN